MSRGSCRESCDTAPVDPETKLKNLRSELEAKLEAANGEHKRQEADLLERYNEIVSLKKQYFFQSSASSLSGPS